MPQQHLSLVEMIKELVAVSCPAATMIAITHSLCQNGNDLVELSDSKLCFRQLLTQVVIGIALLLDYFAQLRLVLARLSQHKLTSLDFIGQSRCFFHQSLILLQELLHVLVAGLLCFFQTLL